MVARMPNAGNSYDGSSLYRRLLDLEVETRAGFRQVLGAMPAGPRFDARQYGAIPDGRTDSREAIQAAVDAMIEANAGGFVYLAGGDYLIDGPISLTAANGTDLVGFGVVGEGLGQHLIQAADDEPHFVLEGSNMHSLSFDGFAPTWSTPASESATHRNVIESTSSGNWYNSDVSNMHVSNGHYVVSMAESMNAWGIHFANIRASAMSGGFSRLSGGAGQPNNSFTQIYVGAQTMVGPIFDHNAVNAVMESVEINQADLGPVILRDRAGGNYVASLFGVEGGTWATPERSLFSIDDTCLLAQHIFLTGTVTETTSLFRTAGRGLARVGFLILDFDVQNDSHLFVAEVGGRNVGNPNQQRGEVIFDRIRGMTDLVSWTGDRNGIALCNVSGSESANAVAVSEWNDPSRMCYRAAESAELGPGDARVNVIAGEVNERTTFTLPPGAVLFSGRAFTFVKSEPTNEAVAVADNNGNVFVTLPPESRGRATVVWNRSLDNGPGLDRWTVIEMMTW